MNRQIEISKRLLESKGYIIEKVETYWESNLYEMANIKKDRTELPYDIWVDSLGYRRKVPHNSPRIKVEVDGEMIPFSISDSPEILVDKKVPHESDILKFIIDNKEIFLKHWNGDIDDGQIINLFTLIYKKGIPREDALAQIDNL